MTRARPATGRSRTATIVALASVALVVVAALVLLGPGAAPAAAPSPGAAGAAVASPSGSPARGTGSPRASQPPGSPAPSSASPSGAPVTAAASRAPSAASSGAAASPSAAIASGGGTALATPGAASPSGTAAPTSAVGFDPRHTVVPMAFPLPASARYRYGDAWRTPRLGIVYPYNQIRGVAPGGTLLRAHDGVDLQVPIGTLVVAPFAGVVVDPAKTWKPWDPQRYGKVVVIRSTEATSRGYAVILVHLSRQSVQIGQTVRRGQVVGRTGISGNAAETIPHLHIELRSPFRIAFHYAGVLRYLDDFDPLPSLRAADPKLPH